MEFTSLLGFLALIALGSFIQTLSGFAIALIITGGVTALDLAPIAFTVNVVSFITLINVMTATHRQTHQIHMTIFLSGAMGILLMSGMGLLALDYLSERSIRILEALLGLVILASAIILIVRPREKTQISAKGIHFLIGMASGFLSGLFGAGGPPMVLHIYRQPLSFAVIRTTLLILLATMAITRLSLEAWAGHISLEMVYLGLWGVPISIIFTVLARRMRKKIPSQIIRRLAFILLCLIAIRLIFQ